MDEKNQMLVKFGRAIKEARKKLKMTQDELSLYTRIDRSYISEIETGNKNPSLTTILALAKALHLKPSNLMQIFESKDNSTEED